MTKTERLTTCGFLVAFLLFLIGAFLWNAAHNGNATADATSSPVHFPAGSSVELDSSSGDIRYTGEDGVERSIDFGWTGSMTLTVGDSELYMDEDAKQKAKELGAQFAEGDDRLLLVTCRLHNTSAVPTNVDFTGTKSFSASIFGIPGLESRYFSAATCSPENHEYFSFQLPTGEELTFTLGYPWQSDKNGMIDKTPSIMTPGIDGTRGHYQLELGTKSIG